MSVCVLRDGLGGTAPSVPVGMVGATLQQPVVSGYGSIGDCYTNSSPCNTVLCSVSNCKNCSRSYLTCTECSEGYSFSSDGKQCVKKRSPRSLVGQYYQYILCVCMCMYMRICVTMCVPCVLSTPTGISTTSALGAILLLIIIIAIVYVVYYVMDRHVVTQRKAKAIASKLPRVSPICNSD